MTEHAIPDLLPWQVELLDRLLTGEHFVITLPRMWGRTSWVRNWEAAHAVVFLNYLKVWDAPGGTRQIEPPRRPPSWYPGQPEQRPPRFRPCTCFYGLRQVRGAPGPYTPVPPPSGEGNLSLWTRCFVIVWDCPHHGDDRYDPATLDAWRHVPDEIPWETTLGPDERT